MLFHETLTAAHNYIVGRWHDVKLHSGHFSSALPINCSKEPELIWGMKLEERPSSTRWRIQILDMLSLDVTTLSNRNCLLLLFAWLSFDCFLGTFGCGVLWLPRASDGGCSSPLVWTGFRHAHRCCWRLGGSSCGCGRGSGSCDVNRGSCDQMIHIFRRASRCFETSKAHILSNRWSTLATYLPFHY